MGQMTDGVTVSAAAWIEPVGAPDWVDHMLLGLYRHDTRHRPLTIAICAGFDLSSRRLAGAVSAALRQYGHHVIALHLTPSERSAPIEPRLGPDGPGEGGLDAVVDAASSARSEPGKLARRYGAPLITARDLPGSGPTPRRRPPPQGDRPVT